MSRPTKEQAKWYQDHNDELQAEKKKLSAEIAMHLSDAFEDMSELENLLNTGMKHAGYDTYALSRDNLNQKREEIIMISRRHMKFMDRLEDQKAERRRVSAFNAVLNRAEGVN